MNKMFLFGVSDVAITQFANMTGAFFSLVSACFTAYLTFVIARIRLSQQYTMERDTEARHRLLEETEKAQRDREHMLAVSERNGAGITQLQSVAMATHLLVNSKMCEHLRKHYETAQELADLTQSPIHQHAAAEAFKAWKEQEARNAAVPHPEGYPQPSPLTTDPKV